MADLKFGGVTPGTGDIKVGSSNVSKIYQGSTLLWPLGVAPQPGEVTICDLVWTKTNSTITATTTGGNIPITTDATGWVQAVENQQAAACWYKNDQATYGHLGLFYNKFCLDVIQPPTGFRLPTIDDWTDLRDCLASGQPQSTYANQIVNNYYNLWPSAVNSLSEINTIDFNSIAGGYTNGARYGSGNTPYQAFFNSPSSFYWHSDQNLTTNPRRALGMIHAYSSYNNYVYLNYLNSTTDASLPYNSSGFTMRFVKDAPPPVQLYDNDTQTGPTVSSIVEPRLSPVGNSGSYINSAVDVGSVVIPAGGGYITFAQYLTNSTTPNITDAYFTEGRIRLYTTPQRNTFPVWDTQWLSSNQGGPWSPDGEANKKEVFIFLGQGTYYIRLGYLAQKPNPPGPAYQVTFNTAVYSGIQ
jgi:uncharacterized protein (TIGR02145 family)